MVNFLTGIGYCELSAESKDSFWIVRILPDGSQVRMRNMQKVESFPSTSLTRAIDRAVVELAGKLVEYMACADAQRKNVMWWEIRDRVKEI